MAAVDPEGVGLREVAREGRLYASSEGEDGVGTGHGRSVIGVATQLVGIHLLTAFEELEEHVGVVHVQLPEAVCAATELLFDAQLADEVEVDMSGHVEECLLDGVRSIRSDVESAGEAVALRIDGHEGQVGAWLTAHVDGVHDVIMIEGVGQGGRERADEAVQQEGDVVVEDVDALEDLLEVGRDRAVFVEALVDALLTRGTDDDLFGSGLTAVVDVGDLLTQGEREDGAAVELGGVEVVLQELESLEHLALLQSGVELIEREGHLFVALRAVVVQLRNAVAVLAGHDALHQLHGGVVLAGIAFAFGADNDLGELDGGGCEADAEVGRGVPGGEGDGLGVIAHVRDLEACQPAIVLQLKVAIHVGDSTDGGSLENERDEGQGFASDGVDHHASNGSSVLCVCGLSAEADEQKDRKEGSDNRFVHSV